MFPIMKNTIWGLTALLALAGCSDFLDPLPNGHYTDENLNEYLFRIQRI